MGLEAMSSNQTKPPYQLLTQIKAMLAYWQVETAVLQGKKLVEIDKERFNLFYAIQKGLHLLPAETAPLILQILPLIERRGYWKEWLPIVEKALDNNQQYDSHVKISLMAHLGKTYMLNQQYVQAIATHLQAKEMAQKSGDETMLAVIHHDLMEDYMHTCQYAEAQEAGKQAILLYEKCKIIGKGLANSYKMLGVVYYEAGQLNLAETNLRHAVSLWRQLDDPLYLARSLNDLGNTLRAADKYEAAESSFCEAAALLAPTINEFDKCMVQINLGSLYAAQQNWQAAKAAFQTANSPYLRQSPHASHKASVYNNLGYVAFKQGRDDEAKAYLQQAVTIWDLLQNEIEQGNTLSTLGDIWAAQGEYQKAIALYEEAVTLLAKYPQSAFAARLCHQYTTILASLKEN